ncbi:MAG: TonB-dependent receptor, partial [Tepidimonas sp.]|uniref:TonB-dependent receptor domain-containing protein n=1 Tax=Tepidimonas sp. TaxID=2002775 RepID=UPI00259EDFA7
SLLLLSGPALADTALPDATLQQEPGRNTQARPGNRAEAARPPRDEATAGAADEQSLAPVSVTAKGYASEDLETPVSTSALDRDELLRRNAQNPGEALRGEPGLAVASDGAGKDTVNISQVTLYGFEAQGKWQPRSGHWLKAGLSVVRGTNDALDEPLFQMPADELTLGWEGNVTPNWTTDATGRFVRRQNRVATVFSRGSENETGGFATVDVGATWRYAKSQSLRIGVKNLFDRAYREHLALGVSGQEIPMPGRSLVLGWRGEF